MSAAGQPSAARRSCELPKLPACLVHVASKVDVIVTLGQIAHTSTAKALGLAPGAAKFGYGLAATAPDGRILLSSYHCSRQNTNTDRLTWEMFESIFERALAYRSSTSRP